MSQEELLSEGTTPIEPLFTAEADQLETGVESTGANQQTREDAIRQAEEFRKALTDQTFNRIVQVVGRDRFKLGFERKRFMRTELNRRNYIERGEQRAQEWIEELLSRLDLEDEIDKAFITQELKKVFIDLKFRLLKAEMETRRLAFKVYGESTYTKETWKDRKWRIASGGEEETDIAELVLAEIDGMRHEEGMSDPAIYRQLMRTYHPDVSQNGRAHEITQLIYGLYDAAEQHFII